MSTEIIRMGEFSRSTEVAIHTLDGVITMSVNDILKLEPNAPYNEAMKFLMTCRAIGVNPLIREAFLVEIKGKWSTIIAKYGYLKCAERHRNQDGELDFGGFEAGIVIREQATDPRGNPIPGKVKGLPIEIEGSILPQGFLLVGGWAKVWRKGVDRPFKSAVSLVEYDQDNHTWKTKKCTMIRKVALVHSLREAFAVGDSYDEAEQEPVPGGRAHGQQPAMVTARVVDDGTHAPASLESMCGDYVDPPCTDETARSIMELKDRLGMTDEKFAVILSRKGYTAVSEMTAGDAKMLLSKFREVASREEFVSKFPDTTPDDGRAPAIGGPVGGAESPAESPAELEPVAVGAGAYADIPTDGPDEE